MSNGILIKNIFCFFQIIFVFVSSLEVDNIEFGNHLTLHGDGVRDVAFEVEELDIIFEVNIQFRLKNNIFEIN